MPQQVLPIHPYYTHILTFTYVYIFLLHLSIFMLLLITHFLGASFCFSGHIFIEARSKYFCYVSVCAMCTAAARMWIKLSSFSSTPLQHMQHAYAYRFHMHIRVIVIFRNFFYSPNSHFTLALLLYIGITLFKLIKLVRVLTKHIYSLRYYTTNITYSEKKSSLKIFQPYLNLTSLIS